MRTARDRPLLPNDPLVPGGGLRPTDAKADTPKLPKRI